MSQRIQTVLSINSIRLKAHHGYYAAERKIGGMYSISVKVHMSADASEDFLEISDTVNYEVVYEVVCATMAEEFELIETTCKALWNRLKLLKADAEWEVCLLKEDVPIKHVGSTSFTIKA